MTRTCSASATPPAAESAGAGDELRRRSTGAQTCTDASKGWCSPAQSATRSASRSARSRTAAVSRAARNDWGCRIETTPPSRTSSTRDQQEQRRRVAVRTDTAEAGCQGPTLFGVARAGTVELVEERRVRHDQVETAGRAVRPPVHRDVERVQDRDPRGHTVRVATGVGAPPDQGVSRDCSCAGIELDPDEPVTDDLLGRDARCEQLVRRRDQERTGATGRVRHGPRWPAQRSEPLVDDLPGERRRGVVDSVQRPAGCWARTARARR